MGEVAFDNTDRSCHRWYLCQKGGPARRWFGNHEYVVNWENDGALLRSHPSSTIRNERYYFQEGVTWSTLSVSRFTMRYNPPGFIFESKGAVCFPNNTDDLSLILAFGNSVVASHLLAMTSPTVDFHEGPFGRLPIPAVDKEYVTCIAKKCVCIAKADWDSFETSWDFAASPLLGEKENPNLIGSCYEKGAENCRERISTILTLEQKNNQLFYRCSWTSERTECLRPRRPNHSRSSRSRRRY